MPPARCTSSMWYLFVFGATLLLRHDARQAVDVLHREVDAGFLRDRQQVQDRVGRTAHRDVERHRVLERLEAHRARQHAFVVLLVVLAGEFDDATAGALEQLLAVGVRGHHRAVAGQRQAERFGQAVHRVRGEHARARTAGRAGRAFDFGDFGVGIRRSTAITIASTRSSFFTSMALVTGFARRVLPASIGPPDTKITGMLRRIAAISIPGVILSQFEMQTIASAQCAFTMYSTESAMMSRLGSESACRRGPSRCRRRPRSC